jgi:hypothetical protein
MLLAQAHPISRSTLRQVLRTKSGFRSAQPLLLHLSEPVHSLYKMVQSASMCLSRRAQVVVISPSRAPSLHQLDEAVPLRTDFCPHRLYQMMWILSSTLLLLQSRHLASGGWKAMWAFSSDREGVTDGGSSCRKRRKDPSVEHLLP